MWVKARMARDDVIQIARNKNKEHSCWCSRAHGVPPWEAAFLATDKAWITHVRKFGRKWREKLSLFWTTLKCQLSVCCLITISQRVETWPTTSSQEGRNEMGSGQSVSKTATWCAHVTEKWAFDSSTSSKFGRMRERKAFPFLPSSLRLSGFVCLLVCFVVCN